MEYLTPYNDCRHASNQNDLLPLESHSYVASQRNKMTKELRPAYHQADQSGNKNGEKEENERDANLSHEASGAVRNHQCNAPRTYFCRKTHYV